MSLLLLDMVFPLVAFFTDAPALCQFTDKFGVRNTFSLTASGPRLGLTARAQLNFPAHFRSESERDDRPWNVHFGRSSGISPRRFGDGMRWPERPGRRSGQRTRHACALRRGLADGARRMAARREGRPRRRLDARHHCDRANACN